MLVVKSFISSFDIEPEQLLAVLESLSKKNYCPAILESERTIAKLAGIDGKYNSYGLRFTESMLPMRRKASAGDIFFCDHEIYYLVSASRNIERVYFGDAGEEYYTFAGTDKDTKIEIGIFSSDPASLESHLRNFANDVAQAVKATLDGRKVRHMDLSWNEVVASSTRLDQILSTNEDQGVQFKRATVEEKEVEASSTPRPRYPHSSNDKHLTLVGPLERFSHRLVVVFDKG